MTEKLGLSEDEMKKNKEIEKLEAQIAEAKEHQKRDHDIREFENFALDEVIAVWYLHKQILEQDKKDQLSPDISRIKQGVNK